MMVAHATAHLSCRVLFLKNAKKHASLITGFNSDAWKMFAVLIRIALSSPLLQSLHFNRLCRDISLVQWWYQPRAYQCRR